MKPRILMFGWEFPPHNSGGLGTACLGICRSMVKQNIDLIFVLPKKIGNLEAPAKIEFAGLEDMIFESVNSLLYPYITAGGYGDEWEKAEHCFYGPTLFDEVMEYACRAEIIARKHDYDIIHAHDWLTFPAGLKARAATGKPLVVHVHATEFDRTGGLSINDNVYRIEKEGMEKADGIIAVSQWTKNLILKHYGIKEDKVRVVHNGIDQAGERLRPRTLAKLKKSGQKIVLFVGRITLQKGPDYFIEAARKVLAQRPDTYFIMTGSGDMEPAMIRRVAELGISDRMIFAGFLRGGELAGLYQSADLYILPSVSEPFGLTPLESLTHGTPVLISKQSGVSEVLTHALKVDFWDIDEMANKIIAVIDNPSLYRDLKTGGAAEVKKITWDKAVAGYLDFYQSILNRFKPA